MYIGVRAFGVNVWSNFILIRDFDWPYKKFIVRSGMANFCISLCHYTSTNETVAYESPQGQE